MGYLLESLGVDFFVELLKFRNYLHGRKSVNVFILENQHVFKVDKSF